MPVYFVRIATTSGRPWLRPKASSYSRTPRSMAIMNRRPTSGCSSISRWEYTQIDAGWFGTSSLISRHLPAKPCSIELVANGSDR